MNYQDIVSQFNVNLENALKTTPSLKKQDGFILRIKEGRTFLIIQENQISKSKEYMPKKGITGLEINISLGYAQLDVNFLENFKFLKSLTILHQPLGNTKAINNLYQLEYLSLDAYFYTEIDFNNFSNLQNCSLYWTKNAINIFNCSKLKTLHIRNYKKDDLLEFENLELLERLIISASPIKNLNGLSSIENIKQLDLQLLTKLTSLDGIEKLPLLEKLNIKSCKKVQFEKIWMLKKLKFLNLSEVSDIPTIKPIKNIETLEEVYITGANKIIDGDTTPLLNLSKLKKVGLAHRTNYKPTTLEIQAKVEKKDIKVLLKQYGHIKIYRNLLNKVTA